MRVIRIVCLVVALVAGSAAAFAEQRYALVIGSNPGWSQDRPLRYADSDAERVRDVLVALGSFSPDRVEMLRDPSTADVRTALRRLADKIRGSGEDTLVFFYYSGHADDRFLHLRGEPMSHGELQDTLRGLPATIKLAVLDACKSGAVASKGGAPTAEFDLDVVSPKLSGMVILTSSGADELSQESRALAGSVFTHHLVSGLRGAADDNGDHEITVAEAYHYAYTRTRADTATSGPRQRPAFRYELSGQGELVLTRLAAARDAQIELPRGPAERYVVLDAHEWRLVAEARTEPSHDVVLDLAPGTYHIKRVLDDRLEVGSVALAAGDRKDASRLAYAPAPLGTGILKGDPNDLSPAERHDWARARAFGLLAEGQPMPALGMFDQLLREMPGDTLAWRGRARALVRLAEAYERVNDTFNERRALMDAMKADPSLSEDPLFQIWYQRLGTLEGREKAATDAKIKLEQDLHDNPRVTKHYGVGFDVFSSRGDFAITASMIIHHVVFPTIGIDVAGPGLDVGITIAPFPRRWTPYLGLGGHVSATKLGLQLWGGQGMVTENMDSYSYEEMWGLHARAEVGAQFVGTSGFTTELGLATMTFQTTKGETVAALWPVLHFGWLW